MKNSPNAEQPDEFCVVLTTVNSPEQENLIIRALLESSIAACIQTLPISSHYVWKGKVCSDKETLLVIKTQKKCYQALEQTICTHHEYDVPQIVQLEIKEGFNPYLTWIEQVTGNKE